jgi:hypothetical protein
MGVLSPKETKLDVKQKFDEIQRTIFKSLAKKHNMMDVLKNGRLNFEELA